MSAATASRRSSTGVGDTIGQLEGRGITVLLSGVPERHGTVLDALGVYDSLAHERHVFATTPEAIAHARLHVARIPHEIPAEGPQARVSGPHEAA